MQSKPLSRTENLKRLLNPRHIAFIGGGDADYSARQCAKRFSGEIWGVNPKRSDLGGCPCYPSVKDLPEAPDAVFLATPKPSTIQVLKDLNEMGAGGVVCFTAGFGETGGKGKVDEKELVLAAGNIALVGPNCYGLINYIRDATLWPFGAGSNDSKNGVALIMQSGMITADMAMNQRSVPISYVISAGNQAMLAIEDYIDVLVDDPHVSGFGIYIEGIVDVKKFADASYKALKANKPIVLLKSGSSNIGAQLAVSHTGSLSGADEAHQALFDSLGIIRVRSPELMLESLKFMTVSGIPKGNRVAAFTCSGGEALMVADYCELNNLALPQPSKESFRKLTELLPDIATVSNPLDYTTPLWGNTEVMPKVFSTALEDGFDAAIFIQDYPPEEFDADSTYYRADGRSFMDAVNAAGIPGGICSELSENFDAQSREIYVAGGVTPMQGLDRGLDSIRLASEYYKNRKRILENNQSQIINLIRTKHSTKQPRLLNEWESKQLLESWGLELPARILLPLSDLNKAETEAEKLGFPVVAKLVSENLAHKTELGVVQLNLTNGQQVSDAVEKICNAIEVNNPENDCQGILIEKMVDKPLHELLVGIKADTQFGLVMVIASGGTLVELYKDARTLLLPTNSAQIKYSLSQLKCYPLFCGYRGRPQCDIDKLTEHIMQIAEFAESRSNDLVEMDINPLMVFQHSTVIVDALIKTR